MAVGTGTIDFGSLPAFKLAAPLVVGGQSGLTMGAHIEAWFMKGDSTAENTAADHEWAASLITLTCFPVSSTQFEVSADVDGMLASGTFKFHYAWSN